MNEKKEVYVQPALVTHELVRDITAAASGFCRMFRTAPPGNVTCPR